MTKCTDPSCECFPSYGCAPHECYWKKPGGFDNKLGTSTIKPLADWPDDFRAEINRDIPVRDQLSYGLCGVYFCQSCGGGVEDYPNLMSKQEVITALDTEKQEASLAEKLERNGIFPPEGEGNLEPLI